MRGVTITYNTFPVRKTFQLTRLMRGVTICTWASVSSALLFQLTRLMRGVTSDMQSENGEWFKFQLTRLMRGVTDVRTGAKWYGDISTHTPHARRDRIYLETLEKAVKFQLTRLMRGVTASARAVPRR